MKKRPGKSLFIKVTHSLIEQRGYLCLVEWFNKIKVTQPYECRRNHFHYETQNQEGLGRHFIIGGRQIKIVGLPIIGLINFMILINYLQVLRSERKYLLCK